MKKIFAIIMTICLLAALLCVPAFAASNEPANNEPAANIVLRVSALKTDGSPNDLPVVIKDYDNFQDGWNYAMELAGDEDVMKEKSTDALSLIFMPTGKPMRTVSLPKKYGTATVSTTTQSVFPVMQK
jgi:hypothetical protein